MNTTLVRLRAISVALVLIAMSAAPVRGQTTALYIESQGGDHIGDGETHTYSSGDATIAVATTSNIVHATVDGAGSSFFWQLMFAAPADMTFGPGTYLDAVRFRAGLRPGLDISANGSGCNETTGRFVVREFVRASDGSVERFAADFEQHCDNADSAVFGVIRYNSTVSTIVPFDGAYPDYRLTVTPAAHGSVTGGGLACSQTQNACARTLTAPATIDLIAVPDAGYTFIGWRGSCLGLATIPMHVNQPLACEALFDSTSSPALRTGLFLDSESGDFVGDGHQWLYSAFNGKWAVTPVGPSGRGVRVSIDDVLPWTLNFDPGSGEVAAPATYSGAMRYPFNTVTPGLDIAGRSGGCNEGSGWFVVRELVKASDGSIVRYAADFEQHCDNRDAALYGAVRYNSTVSLLAPFDGSYPDYRLIIVPGLHGSVTSDALNCGGSQNTCVQTVSSPTTVSLVARPDPDYVFTGWIGDCSGSQSATIRVNGRKECSPTFAPFFTRTRRSLLMMFSQQGDFVGAGENRLYSSATALWSVLGDTSGLEISVNGRESWSLLFRAPEGSRLAPGSYPDARGVGDPAAAWIGIFGDGRGCSSSGRFVVREIVAAPDGSIASFAADFEQHCDSDRPGLRGIVRYNSAVGLTNTIPPLAPTGLTIVR